LLFLQFYANILLVMNLYESLQANVGPHMVGLSVPGTDIEISRPLVPFAEVHFDNNTLAVVGTLAVAGGIYKAIQHGRATSEYTDTIDYPAGSDEGKKVRRNILSQGKRNIALGLLLTGAISASAYDAADPYTNEKVNEIDSIAVVIDSGYEAYTRDVTTDGETNTSRIEATVNSLNQLELDGVDVTFIAAGVEPAVVGSIVNGEGRNDVVDGFTEYTSGISQRGSVSNGGGDIETSLSIAEGLGPDKIIVFTGTLQGNDQSQVLEGEDIEGNDYVSVITVGKSGSTVESLGTEVPAPVEPGFNELIVGVADSYSAESTNELKDVVNGIINDQVQSDVRKEVKFFQKMLIASVAGFMVIGALVLDKNDRNLRSEVKKNRK
jgi:hypothetical protein